MDDSTYRSVSLWHDTVPGALTPRPPLPGDTDADVAIVGAGYTGLWTAYYLAQLDPSLRIVVVEKEIAGFGASGRNGGWASALFPTPWQRIARDSSRHEAVALQHALNDSVDEVGRVAAAEGIDCQYAKGGYVSAARNQAQWVRAQREVEHARSWGFGDDFLSLLGPDEVTERVRAEGVVGGTYTPWCAALHPARLVRGLAEAVERGGVHLYEQTTVTGVGPGSVATTQGNVRADVVLMATEGYTPDLDGHRRDLVPMYSLMVATEPLDDATWQAIGLDARETFSDKRHLRIYGQRTADGRIAFGGRGAPYHYGSRISPDFDHDDDVHAMLRRIVGELFPAAREATFTHAWGGNLGIPRDWYPSVGFDRMSGVAWAGGYVGDGVATANLAGRTLAELITKTDSPRVALPWVGRRSRRWEPEPARWIGANAVTALMARGDKREAATGAPSRSVAAFWRTLGF
ncbi:MAG: FAD-binding oxidoreductase [Actinomycetes bacterium]